MQHEVDSIAGDDGWVAHFITKMNEKFGDLPEDEKPMVGVDIWQGSNLPLSAEPTYDYNSILDFVQTHYLTPEFGTEYMPAIIKHNEIFDDYAVVEELEEGTCCVLPCECPEGCDQWGNPVNCVCDDVDSEQDCINNYPGRGFQSDIEVLEGVAVLFLSDGDNFREQEQRVLPWLHGGLVKSAYYTVGFMFTSTPNEENLQILSSLTHGHYFPAEDMDALNLIIDTLLQQS